MSRTGPPDRVHCKQSVRVSMQVLVQHCLGGLVKNLKGWFPFWLGPYNWSLLVFVLSRCFPYWLQTFGASEETNDRSI
jgi:hypothetical protein